MSWFERVFGRFELRRKWVKMWKSWHADDLDQLICIAAEVEPWKKPHGQIMKAWGDSSQRAALKPLVLLQFSRNIVWQEVLDFFEAFAPANIHHQNPNYPDGCGIAWSMTLAQMMIIIRLLERISASKAAIKKEKCQKEFSQKVCMAVYFCTRKCWHLETF